MAKIGIYGIHNTTTGKWYVGSSNNIESRLDTHIKSIKEKKGAFEYINDGDDFKYEILKVLPDCKNIELWENYFIGLYNSLDGGYNKILSSRKPNIVVSSYKPCISVLDIMDDDDLSKMLKLHDEDDLFEIKSRIPHIIISGKTKRYDRVAVINFLIAESKLNTYLAKNETEVSEWFKQAGEEA